MVEWKLKEASLVMPDIDSSPAAGCLACGSTTGFHPVNHHGFTLRACEACGLWSSDARLPADYEAAYELAEYQQEQTAPLLAAADHRAFIRHPTYAAFFSRVKPNGPLLDIGCGVGRFVGAARALGWDARGIDVSESATKTGRDAGLPLSTQSMASLAAAGESFAAICAFEVLEHVPMPVEFVREAMGLLKPGGRFFCTVPNRESPTVLATRRPDWLPPIHLQFYTANALRTVLERAGLVECSAAPVWVNTFGAHSGSLLRYAAKRILGRITPDPLGLWATGVRPESQAEVTVSSAADPKLNAGWNAK